MSDADFPGSGDDLDAFFSAASGSNPEQLQQAAQKITAPEPAARHVSAAEPPEEAASLPEAEKTDPAGSREPPPDTTKALPGRSGRRVPVKGYGRFYTIRPPAGSPEHAGLPFVVMKADIRKLLPWWGWLSAGISILMLGAGVILLPGVTLNRLVARLDDANPAHVQHAMRQLVVRGDERTVSRLHSFARSETAPAAARLRAVDTLALMGLPQADRALLQIELSGEADSRLREAAGAARRQREASRTRRSQ